jgi:hypothetical protein
MRIRINAGLPSPSNVAKTIEEEQAMIAAQQALDVAA